MLRLVELPLPEPGAAEVRIRVCASGVNPSDWKRREGLYRAHDDVAFPAGVGVEAAGVVEAIGEGVGNAQPGEAVFGFGSNTAAEHALLSHWVRKPEAMTFEEAAGLPVTSETALRALGDLDIAAGQTLLVSGAAGGVGSAVVQLARHAGLTVIGTASERNHAALRELGAIPTTYGPGLAERVRGLAPNGVDRALDVAGHGVVPVLIELVGRASQVVSVADFSAEALGAKFSRGPPSAPQHVLEEIVRLWSEGVLRARIDRVFPLERTAEAHDVSQSGHAAGKLIIVPHRGCLRLA